MWDSLNVILLPECGLYGTCNKMIDYKASETEEIVLKVGDKVNLESLRQAVVPPYILIVPYIDLPDIVKLIRQESLNEDGVHGCFFTLSALSQGEGIIRVGFKDLRSGKKIIEKSIDINISDVNTG
jgi:hypothetical protein